MEEITEDVQKKQSINRLRFSGYDDVVLLQEVVKLNPYTNGWKNVRESVVRLTGKGYNTRCLREHVQYLLELHSREDYATRRNLFFRSGTEEQRALKDELILQLRAMLYSMGRKYGCKRAHETVRERAEKRDGHFLYISNDYLHPSPNPTLGVHENTENPEQLNSNQSTANQIGDNVSSSDFKIRFHHPRPSRYKDMFLSLLKERHEREDAHNREMLTLKKQKLQLARDRLEFERVKFELERKEKETKLEMARKELEQSILREKKQQDIIDSLLLLIRKDTTNG